MSRLTERIENFNRAYLLFEKALAQYLQNNNDDVNCMALVQGFEIVYELGWKVLKDYLSQNGIEVFTPKEVIKESFNINILPTAQVWIDMIKDRNTCSHEYRAEKIIAILDKISTIYAEELKRFSVFVEKINEQ